MYFFSLCSLAFKGTHQRLQPMSVQICIQQCFSRPGCPLMVNKMPEGEKNHVFLSCLFLLHPCIPPLSLFCCSVAKLCPTLCETMDWSTPGSFVIWHWTAWHPVWYIFDQMTQMILRQSFWWLHHLSGSLQKVKPWTMRLRGDKIPAQPFPGVK